MERKIIYVLISMRRCVAHRRQGIVEGAKKYALQRLYQIFETNIPRNETAWNSSHYLHSWSTRFKQGVTKRCHPSLLTNRAFVGESKCGGMAGVTGSQPMSTALHHITWHGVQINFGDLPPYLTYGFKGREKEVDKRLETVDTKQDISKNRANRVVFS